MNLCSEEHFKQHSEEKIKVKCLLQHFAGFFLCGGSKAGNLTVSYYFYNNIFNDHLHNLILKNSNFKHIPGGMFEYVCV